MNEEKPAQPVTGIEIHQKFGFGHDLLIGVDLRVLGGRILSVTALSPGLDQQANGKMLVTFRRIIQNFTHQRCQIARYFRHLESVVSPIGDAKLFYVFLSKLVLKKNILNWSRHCVANIIFN